MFFSHRRILSLPVSPGSLSFQSSRKGTPTYSLFPHLFIVAPHLNSSCELTNRYTRVIEPQKQFGQKLFDFAISRRTLAMNGLSIITFENLLESVIDP